MAITSTQAGCRHCGSTVPEEAGSAGQAGFCCAGCQEVHGLLRAGGLDRYYDLAGSGLAPVASLRQASSAWLTPILAQAEGRGGIASCELDVQGIHCAACVWLLGELFRRQGGGARITVNPALGKVHLSWRTGAFALAAYVEEAARFGYRFGPSRKAPAPGSRAQLLRLGFCAALAMNVMTMGWSFHLGLAPADGELFALFTKLSAAFTLVAVLVGGWPFFRAAVLSLRRGFLHLDLPIAAGLVLATAASFWKLRDGRGDQAYFDTLATFVTLMLLGRWLQDRLLHRNRRLLLEDGGAEGLLVRRREGETLVFVAAPAVREGDRLLLAPGDLLPVDATLASQDASFSTDWITGEARARLVRAGELVPAGSFHSGATAVELTARTSFADSPLPELLRAAPANGAAPAYLASGARVAKLYVLAVLGIAGAALASWWPTDPARALDITVAILVVTCPCALGIAVPLAYELALARLRRRGLFARSAELLDRLPAVRKVIFDKTGTLTSGQLSLTEPALVRELPEELRDAAYDMAARSNHPVSRCLAGALRHSGARFSPAAEVVEEPGLGLSLTRGGARFRLGAPGFALAAAPAPAAAGGGTELGDEGASPAPAAAAAGGGTVLSRDGVELARFHVVDAVRADARQELAALQEEGLSLHLLSGDAPERVVEVAAALGLPAAQASGGLSPREKAARVAALDRRDTLYLGDGINDSLAFDQAFCAGTPAVDRPVLPGKADFFLLGDGIAPLREGIAVARRLRRTVRRNLGLALAYNVLAIAACLAGGMTPLRAAIAMPLSSLTILLITAASLRVRKEPPLPAAAPREALA